MVKTTPLVYSSVRKRAFFGCKTPFFGANLIEIRVKRSKVKVTKWSYMNSPGVSLKGQITSFVVKTMLWMLSKAVYLAYNIAKATFLELFV